MIEIFLVDDHVMFREGLKQVLAGEADFRVTGEAGSGPEAMEKICAGRYDVIVLDISMPGQSGMDILGELRKMQPNTPVLILSMHPEDQYAVRVIKAGASGYLTKESAASELITALRKVASGGKYISESLAERLATALERDSHDMPHHQLSNREFQVLLKLASGETLREIAGDLLLSEKTISTYRSRILEKLDLRNNVELTHYAIRNGLVD